MAIEYFGIAGDPQYQRNVDRKREFWSNQTGVAFVEFNPSQIISLREHGFRRVVLAALDQAEILYRRLSEEEIWERVRQSCTTLNRFWFGGNLTVTNITGLSAGTLIDAYKP